jgi:hypothetical protein
MNIKIMQETCLTAAQDRIGLTTVVIACNIMLKAPSDLRDVAVISCAYYFKVKACFMFHADTRFKISQLNQCMKRIYFLRIGLLNHRYNLILVLGMKQILFCTNGFIKPLCTI